jgi:DNA-binding GntR family transcriptional regulator
MGTSVMPVREALRRLTSEGALEPLSTGATRVPVFDLPKLQDLTEIRLCVESLAVRRAAHRITSEEFQALEQCNLEVQHAIDSNDLAAEAKANERFHFCIYRAAQSSELLRITEHLWLQMGPYLTWLLKQGHWPGRSGGGARAFRHHKDIMRALRRHNAEEAEVALRADLTTAADILMKVARKLLPG